jgi:hypothetical protein
MTQCCAVLLAVLQGTTLTSGLRYLTNSVYYIVHINVVYAQYTCMHVYFKRVCKANVVKSIAVACVVLSVRLLLVSRCCTKSAACYSMLWNSPHSNRTAAVALLTAAVGRAAPVTASTTQTVQQ